MQRIKFPVPISIPRQKETAIQSASGHERLTGTSPAGATGVHPCEAPLQQQLPVRNHAQSRANLAIFSHCLGSPDHSHTPETKLLKRLDDDLASGNLWPFVVNKALPAIWMSQDDRRPSHWLAVKIIKFIAGRERETLDLLVCSAEQPSQCSSSGQSNWFAAGASSVTST